MKSLKLLTFILVFTFCFSLHARSNFLELVTITVDVVPEGQKLRTDLEKVKDEDYDCNDESSKNVVRKPAIVKLEPELD